jgi:leucyl aminopeptidase (aminopeptidase T)
MSDLERAVATVVSDCLAVREGESVLVVANPSTLGLGERMRAEAGRAGAEAMLILMADRSVHGEEPPDAVAAAMAKADVVLCPTLKSLSHTEARRLANDAGARIATLPGITEETLARVMTADMEALRRRSAAVTAALDAGSRARITCANGSDLTLTLADRRARPDDGDLREPGAFGNLPCGEGFIAPIETEGDGTLVVDGTIAGIEKPEDLVELELERGNLVSATGTAGAELLEVLRGAGPGGTGVAELGIGTNEKAILTGNLIEDEKILGSCHVAFGASAGIGGVVQVPVHIDCVVMEPTVEIDGEAILREGKLLL